jgi:ubiquinone/menaquinone biosynthesis C-methylase UbiE
MIRLSLAALALLLFQQTVDEKLPPQPPYEQREVHDRNGINKWYLGRQIAHVMGEIAIPWLERPEREDEENPAKCIEMLRVKPGDVIADLGAGSGYYSFRLAPKVGPSGKVLAVEIQDGMIAELQKRIKKDRVANVETIKCTESDPKLPEKSVDLVLMVDVYHELAFPYEVMTAVRKSLKPGGRLVLVEFRKEDRSVPIKEVHKMSEEQIRKEMEVVGLSHVETIGVLPWQHIAIYSNRKAEAAPGIELGYRLQVPEDRSKQRAQIGRDLEYVVRKRLHAAGVERFQVRLEGEDVTVRLPGATIEQVADLKKLLATRDGLPVSLGELKVERRYEGKK